MPIIFHSAYQDIKDVYEILNDFRPFAYLKKEGQFGELRDTINSAVQHFKQIMKNQILVRELEDMALAYARFVPQQILRFLDKTSITDVKLGDAVQADMTIMFSDIRSFTSLSENMTPQENFDFINDYLGRVGPVIRNNQGYIDKYIGGRHHGSVSHERRRCSARRDRNDE